ncbi:MAG: DUF349 domain-containing protein [Neptuniibacter sp.]
MIASFFKPKWQHPKAEKRIKAVSKMRPANEKKLAILSQLALKDSDERVRVAATEKLTNLNLLIKISKNDPSEITRDQALHNISKNLLSHDSPDLSEKLNVLKSLSDINFLSHIALNSNDKELREQAISQLNDSQSLLTIAEKSQRASIRALAAARISCADALEQLNKFARNKDNGVYKITRDKLQSIKDQEKQEELLQESLNKFLEAVQHHSTTEYFPLYTAKLNALEAEWKDLSAHANQQQSVLLQQGLNHCHSIVAAQEAKEKVAAEASAAKAKAEAEKNNALADISALKESTLNYLPEKAQIENIERSLNSACQHWEHFKHHASGTECSRFDKTQAQLENLLHCFQIYLESLNEIKKLTATLKSDLNENQDISALHQKARQLVNKLSWPKGQAKPSELLSLEEVVADADQQLKRQNQQTQQLRTELQNLLQELETSIQQGEIRSADKQIKRVEQLSKRMNGCMPSTLEARIKILNSELHEIKDWQSYAVTPKKEALCTEMEALISSDLPVQERASKIRKVQKEWKALDSTDANHSQKLWKRFKQASDEAYAPCDKFFSEQKEVRSQNFQLREQLCQQLATRCSASEEVISDWKAYEEDIKKIKQEWRSFSPVDRSPGKKLQAQFDELLKQLEAPLKDFYECNAKTKRELVNRSKELLESEITQQTTDATKELQQQWKDTGQAPRNQERRLWSQFRENCNQIFERFYANKPKFDVNSTQILESLFSEMENALDSAPNISLLEQRAQQAENLLQELQTHNAEVVQPFAVRLKRINHFIEEQKSSLIKFQKAPYQSLANKSQLCDQLEHALLDGDNDAIESVINAWQQDKDQQTALEQEISLRFNTLVMLTQEPDELENIIYDQEQRLRHLCIRLEIASSAPSPAEDQALRMEYQMSRLEQALDRQDKTFDLGEIKQLEFEWMCVPFARHFDELYDRFEEQLSQVL